MLRTSLVALVFALAVPLPATPAGAAQDAKFTVVVHPDVPGTRVHKETLSSVFLKDVKRWQDGSPAHPVDQSLRSPLRVAFTEQALAVPPGGLQPYWNRKIMKGVIPPPVLQTDEEVLEYVARTKGAIGYVSVDVTVPRGVKALAVVD